MLGIEPAITPCAAPSGGLQAWKGECHKVNLGIQLGRDESAANYLQQNLSEFPIEGHEEALLAALEAGVALERFELGRARRSWRRVVLAAEEAGRTARREGKPMRRLAASMDRLREALDLVLFDGRLPSDVAARASRMAAKMSATALRAALLAYSEAASPEQPICEFQLRTS